MAYYACRNCKKHWDKTPLPQLRDGEPPSEMPGLPEDRADGRP